MPHEGFHHLPGDIVRLFPIHGADVEAFHLVVQRLGVSGDLDGFVEQLPGGAAVEGENLTLGAQPLGIGEAGGVDPPIDGEIRLVPGVGGGEAQAQGGDEQMLQLVVGRQRAGAGDDIQSGVQGAAAQIPSSRREAAPCSSATA